MGKSDFSRVSGSAKKLLYGQRGALVCGYTVLDQDALLVMMERWNFGDVPAPNGWKTPNCYLPTAGWKACASIGTRLALRPIAA